MEKLKIGIEIS